MAERRSTRSLMDSLFLDQSRLVDVPFQGRDPSDVGDFMRAPIIVADSVAPARQHSAFLDM